MSWYLTIVIEPKIGQTAAKFPLLGWHHISFHLWLKTNYTRSNIWKVEGNIILSIGYPCNIWLIDKTTKPILKSLIILMSSLRSIYAFIWLFFFFFFLLVKPWFTFNLNVMRIFSWSDSILRRFISLISLWHYVKWDRIVSVLSYKPKLLEKVLESFKFSRFKGKIFIFLMNLFFISLLEFLTLLGLFV